MLDVLPFDTQADIIYGRLRADLERRGQRMGGNDLLIAAHALAAQTTLVTDDRGFAHIPELLRENWWQDEMGDELDSRSHARYS